MTNKATTPPLTGAELDLDKLEALARAALPGEWIIGETFRDTYDDGLAPPETVIRDVTGEAAIASCLDFGRNNPTLRDGNAAFIAAANPATVLRLIAQARAQQAGAAPECSMCNDSGIVGFPPDQYEDCPYCRKARDAAPASAQLDQRGSEAPADYTIDDSELARKIFAFMGRATTGSMEPGADPLRDRLAERLATWRPAVAPSDAKEHSGCGRCGASSVDSCNSIGCGYLESGNGEHSDATGKADAAIAGGLDNVIAWIETDDGLCQAVETAANIKNDHAAFIRLSTVKKLLRATATSAADAGELHFNATRLRNVARLVGLESALPEDDATLDGARGSVLGMIAGKLRNAATSAADAKDAAGAAIAFSLEADEGMEFLRCWNEGDFDACRREWPEAPEAVYIGADPLHPASQSPATSAADARGAAPWEDRYNTGVKPWSFRIPPNQPLNIICDAMQGEIRELRVAIAATQQAAPVAKGKEQTRAARDVLAERRRQVEVEGWTPEHDDEHDDNSMSMAAICYAMPEIRFDDMKPQDVIIDGWIARPHPVPVWWPESWRATWWKPRDRRSNLVKSAALILAEIERIDRVAQHAQSSAKGGNEGGQHD